MKKAVIVSACRTPVGKFLGALKGFQATDLGALAVKEAVRRADLRPEQVDEVIMGNVLSAGLGQNPARQAALRGGLPVTVPALTVNKVCGSGLKAVALAAQSIRAEDHEVIVAGGMESMSNAPFLVRGAREGLRLGHGELVDSMVHDGLWDVYENFHMGCCGEAVAEQYDIPRQAQDEYALGSHRKAIAAIDAGKFKAEIMPVPVPQRKGPAVLFDTDESPRRDSSIEALARLKPAFKEGGTVTAGNAPGVNDGAAALVVMSGDRAAGAGRKPLGEIVAYASSGIEPKMVMMAPVAAVTRVLEKAGWRTDEVDLFELNEAFSVQAVALLRELKLKPERVNVNGGAVALGHPIGCSGARVLTTLLYALADRKAKRGVAALCLGGGNAVAMAIRAL
ncbi:MAG TPA: acetyl-CoA C-acetyltransferase [Candidatus Polarisedimenticolia bacterium]|jgi:acetyl-CoA C-acetyltransferase|nr:acetyl-CoA C-acetyltransferase [Candidatus Polarisedimenticolia bacterium]